MEDGSDREMHRPTQPHSIGQDVVRKLESMMRTVMAQNNETHILLNGMLGSTTAPNIRLMSGTRGAFSGANDNAVLAAFEQTEAGGSGLGAYASRTPRSAIAPWSAASGEPRRKRRRRSGSQISQEEANAIERAVLGPDSL